jgi:Putative peptidoglycan binding domain
MRNSIGSVPKTFLLRPLSFLVATSLTLNGALPAFADAGKRFAPPSWVGDQSFQVADDATPPVAPAPNTPPAPAQSAPVAPDKSAQENVFWQSVEHSNTAADYKAYLDAFPTGLYATLARNRIAALNAPPQPTAAAPVAPQPIAAFPSAFGPPPQAVPPEALRGEIGTVDAEASLGMGPPQHIELQQRLTALGLYSGPIDGDLGPGVRTAIAEWQKRHNLAATGEIGPLQLATLRVESEAPFQQWLAAPHPVPAIVVTHPVYPVRRVIVHAAPAPNYVAPALGLLGGLAIGILGAKLGGKFGGGGKGGGGKGGGKKQK